jgi:hypothetical protein
MATEGARVDASAHGVPASRRDAVRRNAIAIAPERTMLRQCKLPAAFYRLNLRPGRARRLSKAGRHWAPMTWQRATRKERPSGRTGPTYCNKPNSEPPVIDGMERTVARGDSRRKAENVFLIGRISGRPILGDGHATVLRLSPTMSSPRDGPFGRPQRIPAVAGGESNWCFRPERVARGCPLPDTSIPRSRVLRGSRI